MSLSASAQDTVNVLAAITVAFLAADDTDVPSTGVLSTATFATLLEAHGQEACDELRSTVLRFATADLLSEDLG